MMRTYKLASQFNVVEFSPTDKDLLEMLESDEIIFTEDGGTVLHDVPEETLLERLLQREYDILNSIKVVPQTSVVRSGKQTKNESIEEPPSEKQIEFAKRLGMKDPQKHSKKEVWEFIQKHK